MTSLKLQHGRDPGALLSADFTTASLDHDQSDDLIPNAKVSRFWLLFWAIIVTAAYALLWTRWWYPLSDSSLYLSLARSIAEGHGYTYMGEPHRLVPPLTPLFYAGIMRLGGGIGTMQAVCIALMLISHGLCFLTLRRWVGERLALAATLATAMSYWVFINAFTIMSEPPCLALLWGGLLCLSYVAASARSSRRQWALVIAGCVLLLGSAASRAAAVILVPAAVTAMWLTLPKIVPIKRRVQWAAMFLVVFTTAYCLYQPPRILHRLWARMNPTTGPATAPVSPSGGLTEFSADDSNGTYRHGRFMFDVPRTPLGYGWQMPVLAGDWVMEGLAAPTHVGFVDNLPNLLKGARAAQREKKPVAPAASQPAESMLAGSQPTSAPGSQPSETSLSYPPHISEAQPPDTHSTQAHAPAPRSSRHAMLIVLASGALAIAVAALTLIGGVVLLRRRQWWIVGLSLYFLIFWLQWGMRVKPRYMAPIDPLLFIMLWTGIIAVLRVFKGRKPDAAPQARGRLLTAAEAHSRLGFAVLIVLVAGVLALNAPAWAMEVYVHRQSRLPFYDVARRGSLADLIDIGTYLQDHASPMDEIYVNSGDWRRVVYFLVGRKVDVFELHVRGWDDTFRLNEFLRNVTGKYAIVLSETPAIPTWHWPLQTQSREQSNQPAGVRWRLYIRDSKGKFHPFVPPHSEGKWISDIPASSL